MGMDRALRRGERSGTASAGARIVHFRKGSEPFAQGNQSVCCGIECAALPRYLAAGHDAHAGNNCRLVDIETGHPFVHNFHTASSAFAPPAGGLAEKESLGNGLLGIAAPGASEGHQGSQVQLAIGPKAPLGQDLFTGGTGRIPGQNGGFQFHPEGPATPARVELAMTKKRSRLMAVGIIWPLFFGSARKRVMKSAAGGRRGWTR